MATAKSSSRTAKRPAVASRSVAPLRGTSSLDPRITEISWAAIRATATRRGAIRSPAHLAEALRGMADVLERTWDPGRTAALVRIETTPDDDGRAALELFVAVAALGAAGQTEAEAQAAAKVALASLSRYPQPFGVEQVDPSPLLDCRPPQHLVAVRQRRVEAFDEQDSIRTVSRFDRQLESWLDLAGLLTGWGSPIVLQSSFFATTLSPADALWLECESGRAEDFAARAADAQNPVLVRRALRVRDTLVDVADSFSGPLWIGEVTVGSDAPLPQSLRRSIAGAFTNEYDIIHADEASPIVAGRRTLLGGFELEDVPIGDESSRHAWTLGLPGPVFRRPTLRDHFSLTEAAYCFRWPIPAGGTLEGLPTIAARTLHAPAGLPREGLRLGRDSRGGDVCIGADGLRTHLWAPGGTGSGKSTLMRLCLRYDLSIGRPFVLIDPHGDLTRAVRADAAELGRELALIDVDERATLSLDLLGGLTPSQAADAEACARPISRLSEAFSSYRPADEYGPRYRALARAVLGSLISAADRHTLGMTDLSRLLVDDEFLQWVLSVAHDEHAAQVLRLHLRESDRASVALWAASKFEDIASSPGAARVFAPFFRGVSVGGIVDAGMPLVVNLGSSGLSRLSSSLLGHVVLACTVDYVLSREPGNRPPVSLYVDEAQRFPAPNLIDALAESRKYGCSVVVAHQELSQLKPELRDALLSNAAARVLFRTGLADAHALSVTTGVDPADLTALPNLHAFVQFAGQAPFSVELDPPAPVPNLEPYTPPDGLVSYAPLDESATGPAEREVDEEAAELSRLSAPAARLGLLDDVWEREDPA